MNADLTIGDIEQLNFDDEKLNQFTISDLILIERFSGQKIISHRQVELDEQALFFQRINGIVGQEIFKRFHAIFNL